MNELHLVPKIQRKISEVMNEQEITLVSMGLTISALSTFRNRTGAYYYEAKSELKRVQKILKRKGIKT